MMTEKEKTEIRAKIAYFLGYQDRWGELTQALRDDIDEAIDEGMERFENPEAFLRDLTEDACFLCGRYESDGHAPGCKIARDNRAN